jgi:AraC-like DNA-binding protein
VVDYLCLNALSSHHSPSLLFQPLCMSALLLTAVFCRTSACTYVGLVTHCHSEKAEQNRPNALSTTY